MTMTLRRTGDGMNDTAETHDDGKMNWDKRVELVSNAVRAFANDCPDKYPSITANLRAVSSEMMSLRNKGALGLRKTENRVNNLLRLKDIVSGQEGLRGDLSEGTPLTDKFLEVVHPSIVTLSEHFHAIKDAAEANYLEILSLNAERPFTPGG